MTHAAESAPARSPTTATTPPGPLVIEQHRFLLELRTTGRLVPWMGPAIRGIVALRFRAATCLQPRETWHTTWQYCRGCPHMTACGYGKAFEPDAVGQAGGSRDAPRPIVISPEYPVPVKAVPGLRFHVDVTAIGPAALLALNDVARSLVDAGRFDGLGPDRVRFNVIRDTIPPIRATIAANALPKRAALEPLVKDASIRLTGPLFLRERKQAGSRRQIAAPTLGHLFRASMRVAREFLGDAALCPDQGHLELDELAAGIIPSEVAILPFSQDKASHRSREKFGLEGVTGSWAFTALPACLVPWLQLGGMLHVGGHRIAGAGGWDVEFANGPRP